MDSANKQVVNIRAGGWFGIGEIRCGRNRHGMEAAPLSGRQQSGKKSRKTASRDTEQIRRTELREVASRQNSSPILSERRRRRSCMDVV